MILIIGLAKDFDGEVLDVRISHQVVRDGLIISNILALLFSPGYQQKTEVRSTGKSRVFLRVRFLCLRDSSTHLLQHIQQFVNECSVVLRCLCDSELGGIVVCYYD